MVFLFFAFIGKVLDKPIVAKSVGRGAMKGNGKPEVPVPDRIHMPGTEYNRDRPCAIRLDGLSEEEVGLVRASLSSGGAPVVLTGAGILPLSEFQQQLGRQSRRRTASG